MVEIEIFHDDDPDKKTASELEVVVYSVLKYYLRLLPIIDPESKKLKITKLWKSIVQQFLILLIVIVVVDFH